MAQRALSVMGIIPKSETRCHHFSFFGRQDVQKCIGKALDGL